MREVVRKGTTGSGGRRNGVMLNEFLHCDSNLSDKHYAMRQAFIPFLFLLGLVSPIEHYLPTRRKVPRYPRENQEEGRVTVCLQVKSFSLTRLLR
jgi:hypothetical protein